MPVDPNAEIEVTAFNWVPPFAQGFVKDMRVRWALEEIGQRYSERLIGGLFEEQPTEYLAEQPFGQVPVYKENGLILFESGSILIHIGQKDDRLTRTRHQLDDCRVEQYRAYVIRADAGGPRWR
jgi:glutathione S-transferase